jgi:1-acyl-sn-glycerol-3-phosphate acyltransferase
MRTVLSFLTLIVMTSVLGSLVLLAALFRVKDRQGAIYDWAPRLWSRAVLRAAGVRIVLHHPERMRHHEPRIYVSNHVSWFDVFVLASVLPHYKFVGKAELFRIPVFGAAARAAGMIPIVRENRKAAFQSYEVAASRIRQGASVVVYPEGTRGRSYALRPFKKGPFVLAAAAQVPMVPTIIHGTMHVQPRGSYRIRPGVVDVHFFEPIETLGMTYEDRDLLSQQVWTRMAAALRAEYGVESPPSSNGRAAVERRAEANGPLRNAISHE